MRILYFGDPQGAIQLLKAGMELVGLVHGRRGGPGWLGLFEILRERSRDTPRWMRPNLEDLGVQTELRATRPEASGRTKNRRKASPVKPVLCGWVC